MRSEPTIALFSSGLLSKWGFGDGDAPDEWCDYCEAQGVDYNAIDWKSLLVALVRRYLVPELERHHEIEVYEIGTSHNPIRARLVDGVEIDECALDDQVELTPAWVEVPLADALRIALLGPPPYLDRE
jgi:hypothetical protein